MNVSFRIDKKKGLWVESRSHEKTTASGQDPYPPEEAQMKTTAKEAAELARKLKAALAEIEAESGRIGTTADELHGYSLERLAVELEAKARAGPSRHQGTADANRGISP